LRPIVKAGPVTERTIPLSPRYATAVARRAWQGQLDRQHWDVIIAHRAEFLAAVALVRAGRHLPPSVAMLHSHSGHARRAMSPFRGRALLLGERVAISRCDVAVVVSHSSLPYYQQRYPRHADRFRWIPNGVDVARFGGGDRMAWRHRHGFTADDRVLVYHGRYDREKGIPLLLDMMRLLLADENAWHLVTAGIGPLAADLAGAAATWARGRIHDLGYLPGSEIPGLLGAADIGVLCSDFEGLSNSLLECLAAGLPVVATDAGDNALVLDHVSSELVAAAEASSLASAVRWAWAEREHLAPAARRAAQSFSLDSRIERLITLFEGLAGGELGAPANLANPAHTS
ncbi:MAG TPA: glycosyltransferase family 4 protein, partial [Devosia sp.]|nr:glycosyltransferase family 4 protein [Devosia sp.]